MKTKAITYDEGSASSIVAAALKAIDAKFNGVAFEFKAGKSSDGATATFEKLKPKSLKSKVPEKNRETLEVQKSTKHPIFFGNLGILYHVDCENPSRKSFLIREAIKGAGPAATTAIVGVKDFSTLEALGKEALADAAYNKACSVKD